MKQRLFVTLSLAGLAMATFGATKPKAAIKSLNKTTIQQPTYTEWHDLQVNAINRFPLHTNFFTYGMLWGVNNGYLNKKEYKKVIDRAWTYLTETAVQPDGKVGYVQPIGERAIPGQTVDANSQANFGVGAMLLTACEYDKYLANK